MLEHCESAGLEAIRHSVTPKCLDPLAQLDDVVRYAFARLGSREEAEDVAMEVFQAAFRFRAELPRKSNPSLYLIGITRRKIADHLRRNRRQRGAGTVSLDDPGLHEVGWYQIEGLFELIEALNTLSELQRDVLILKYLLGLSTLEISELIKKSPQATNSLLQRARESLANNAPHLVPAPADDRRIS